MGKSTSRGAALVTTLVMMFICLTLGTVLLQMSTAAFRYAARQEQTTRTLFAAESGLQVHKLAIWKIFKVNQTYNAMDTLLTGATVANPIDSRGAVVHLTLRYAVAAVGYSQVNMFSRRVTFRSVGWDDTDGDGVLDAGEARTSIDEVVDYALPRAGVFDYAYFVHNYGWMTGFTNTSLQVMGDMRANGDFSFSGGGMINGSVAATASNKLIPAATGLLSGTYNQQTNATYIANMQARYRQAYSSAVYGAKGGSMYEMWRDFLYDANAAVTTGRISGAVKADSRGTRSFSGTLLDPQPTSEVVMPDLSSISYYQTLSQNYVDTKQTFLDGTTNPYYNQGAYIDVYNPNTRVYERKTTNGVYNGSLGLLNTDSTKPIKIHGPVTVLGDCVIKGTVTGQGTIYTQRNIHVWGSISYANPPDFRGSDPSAVDAANEKKDIVGLAAKGSIWLGDTGSSTWLSNVRQYITPPFTKARLDEDGDTIAAYNGTTADYSGTAQYRTIATGLSGAGTPSQVSAIMYTDHVIGGLLSSGMIYGSYICKDEATVLSGTGTIKFIYDNRIQDRNSSGLPLIDIDLPRAPVLISQTWQVKVVQTTL